MQPKLFSQQYDLGGGISPISITGIAKGAGMIHPNMATMLVGGGGRVSRSARCG